MSTDAISDNDYDEGVWKGIKIGLVMAMGLGLMALMILLVIGLILRVAVHLRSPCQSGINGVVFQTSPVSPSVVIAEQKRPWI